MSATGMGIYKLAFYVWVHFVKIIQVALKLSKNDFVLPGFSPHSLSRLTNYLRPPTLKHATTCIQ
jgi:hypothetical protein